MTLPSSTSPASTFIGALSSVVVPSAETCSIETSVVAGTVTERSVERKSPSLMVET